MHDFQRFLAPQVKNFQALPKPERDEILDALAEVRSQEAELRELQPEDQIKRVEQILCTKHPEIAICGYFLSLMRINIAGLDLKRIS